MAARTIDTTMKRNLQLHVDNESFQAMVALALGQITKNRNTLDAYWRDVMSWLDFCSRKGIDPSTARRQEAAAWIDDMREAGVQSKTRVRRMSSLCSIYRELRRELTDRDGKEIPPVVTVRNPFSIDDGPRRERGNPRKATPVARPDAVKSLVDTCDDSPIGLRDRAILRLLWATGIRRSSAIAMQIEDLHEDREGYLTEVHAKGDKRVRLLVRGQAATALASWLACLQEAGITTGPLWRSRTAALSERALWKMLRRRSTRAGIPPVSPHMLRVSFLTYNRAGLEAKQEAAGHADPATTRLYDRAAWRGREAFELMPEVEEAT